MTEQFGGQGDPCPPPSGGERPTPMVGPRVLPTDIGNDGTWPMPPGSGPCRTWPLESGCGCLAPGTVRQGDAVQPWEGAKAWTPEQQHAVEVATEILWRLTGGRYGLCKEIIRPCRQGPACNPCGPNGAGFLPHVGGTWFNVPCPAHGDAPCGCTSVPEIRLPGPVYWEPLTRPPDWRYQYRPPDREPDYELDGNPSPRYRLIVWIDGQVLSEPGWPASWRPSPNPESGAAVPDPHKGQYWLYGGDRLVRTDGGTWPLCQDLTRPLQARAEFPDEAIGTFGVEYWRGTPVPAGGRRAVSFLACELWKACRGDSTCRLPRAVQSVTREGLQFDFVDQTDYFGQGRTGLPEVDMWLSTVNPKNVRGPQGVWSADWDEPWTEWSAGGHKSPGSW